MAVILSEREKLLFNEAKEFSLSKIAPYADKWENGEKSSKEAINAFVENGYCCIGVPQELGGKGYSFLECTLIYEGLAHGDAAVTSSIIQLHNNIAYMLSKYYYMNEVIRELFPDIVRGRKRLAFAITEKHSGSDASSMNSYAELRHDGYHAYGEKAWIFNSLEADHFVITVKNGSPDTRDMIMLLVDRKTPGFSIGENIRRIGNNCISCCNLYFDGCFIPKGQMITENGFSEALSFIDLPRIFVPSIAIGMSQRMIELTMKYLGAQKSGSKKDVQWILFNLLTQVEAGRCLVYRTASKMDKSEFIRTECAMNKLFATDVAMDVITWCLRLIGESGYHRLPALDRYLSVAKLLQIVDGTSEIQKIVIGREFEPQ